MTLDPTKTHLAHDLTHNAPLITCQFDPKGRYVFGSSEDFSILRWDVANGSKVPLRAHDSWVHALRLTPDGQTLLSGGCDGRLIWWSAADKIPAPVRVIDAHAGWVNSIAVSADGQLIATGGADRMVRLWSAVDGSRIAEFPGHPKYVYQVGFVPGGKFLVTADIESRVIQWEIATRKEVRRLDAGKLSHYDSGQGVDYGGVRDFSFNKDGSLLACAGLIEASNPLGAVSNPAILMLDWTTGKDARLMRPKEDLKGVLWGVRFHPEGFVIGCSGGTSGGFLLFWKPDQVNEYHKLGLPNTARGLDLQPDALHLATAHHDGHLRVWKMEAKA